MNQQQSSAPPVTRSEKILWICAALAGIAALVVGPTVGGHSRAIVIPLVIAGLIAAGALAARRRRLDRGRPTE